MKKILITGKNSYIGTSFEKYILQHFTGYIIDTLDVTTNLWEKYNFSKYDIVFHVAGIAHDNTKNANKNIYRIVNTELPYNIAKKCKESHVRHFIFMSSILVFKNSNVKNGLITKDTIPIVKSEYGKSKLDAETLILSLSNEQFNVSIIRSPIVYGKNSKGNFSKLLKLLKYTWVFPNFYNERSMIYIEHLAAYITIIISKHIYGFHYPQNNKYISTTEIAKCFVKITKQKIMFTKIFNIFIKLLRGKVKILHKSFGNLKYDVCLSKFHLDYNKYSFERTMEKTI